MTEHKRSNARFLPTYATLVGLPVLALLIILRVGESVAPTRLDLVTSPNPASVSAATPSAHSIPGSVPDLPLGRLVRRVGRAAVVISHASILTPFLLGATLAIALCPTLAGDHLTTRRRTARSGEPGSATL